MLYAVFRTLALLALIGFCRFRVTGQEHIPRQGPVILAANHVSNADPVIVGCAVSRKLHYVAKGELFRHRAVGWFLGRVGAFPIRRAQVDPSMVKRSLALLRKGEALLMFPEGTRGDGRRLQPGKPGVGMLALQSGCPVVPIYHEGAAALLPRGGWVPRPRRIRVWIGPPLQFGGDVPEETSAYGAVTQQIMEAIARLQAGRT